MKKVFSISTGKEFENGILVVRLGSNHFAYAICNPGASTLKELGYYTSTEPLDEISLMQVYQDEDTLRHSYDQVRVAFDYPQSIMVPAGMTSQFPAEEAMELQFGKQGPVSLASDSVRGWQLSNQYIVPSIVKEWVSSHFPNARMTQGYTTDLCRVEPTDFEGAISLDFRAEEFSILVSRSNKLLLTQTFPYENPADVLYYVLKTTQQFGFSQEQVRVSISGLIEEESSLYRELHQYFIKLRFRNAEWLVSHNEEKLPAHFFTALYDLAKCE